MRVLITGASGFLGGALARALAASGADVHAIRRAGSRRAERSDLPIRWHAGDVTEPDTIRRALQQMNGVDAVVNAAGRLGEAGVSEEVYRSVNVEGTRNVLAAARALPAPPRVLHLSSAGVLGVTGPVPASEDAPLAPQNRYERSKAESERIAAEFARDGLDVVIARPGFVYGPGDHHVLGLFRAVKRHLFFYVGAGAHVCQPTYIDDAVRGMRLCLENGARGGAYHVTGPRAVTFRELGVTIAGALGVSPPVIQLPRRVANAAAATLEALGAIAARKPPLSRAGVDFFGDDRVFSWQKAHDELGYEPRTDLDRGIPQTVEWYRSRGLL